MEEITAEKLLELYKAGRIVVVPFPKGEWAWHIYRKSKTSNRGWTKRLVCWEQMVAGLAKDPNGIYVKFRDEADKMIERLKEADARGEVI